MQNRTPIPAAARPPVPEFEPVPRKYRHDGWTPERQRAFIAALADTGSVSRAAAMVNMAQANCYTLRRAPGAEGFRRAWEAALDFGVQRLKDIAFERAIEGQLTPVFVGGKLLGYRRVRNDKLLMFCLRHYGQDAAGRRTTINYFSTRASAGAGGEAGGAEAATGAQASTTTLRTVITGGGGESQAARDDGLAATLAGFEGVALDAEASAAIEAALRDCAARRRESQDALDGPSREGALHAAADDPAADWVPIPAGKPIEAWAGELEPATPLVEFVPFTPGELPWTQAGTDILPDYLPYLPAHLHEPAPPPPSEPAGAIAEVAKRPPRRRKPAAPRD